MYVVEVTPTTSTSAYTAGDAVGGKMEFGGVPDYGVIDAVTVIDKDDVGPDLDIVFFNADFTADTDNAAFAVETADEGKLVGVVSVAAADYKDVGAVKIAVVKNIGLPFYVSDSTKRGKVFAQMKTTGTPTLGTTSGLVIRLAIKNPSTDGV